MTVSQVVKTGHRQLHCEVHDLARFRVSPWLPSPISAFYDVRSFHIVTEMHVTIVAVIQSVVSQKAACNPI
jgi:hypothetical protein